MRAEFEKKTEPRLPVILKDPENLIEKDPSSETSRTDVFE
jgi:hypothetical protein